MFVGESGWNLAASILPPGVVLPYAGDTAPVGWAFPYGQAVSRLTYSALFKALGTTYGTGDGSTTFNLPDLRGRAPFGDDNMGGSTAGRITNAISGITGTTLGATGGSESMQSHDHTISFTGGGLPVTTAGTGLAGASAGAGADAGADVGLTGAGSSQNMPPAIILNYIILLG